MVDEGWVTVVLLGFSYCGWVVGYEDFGVG